MFVVYQGLRDLKWPRYSAAGQLQNLTLVERNWKVSTKDGDSPVDENERSACFRHPSTAGHEKSCGKLGGPPSKAKYSLVTDSELVP